MLYTGSVNRIIFWALIPLTLAMFLLFRIVEWRLMDDSELQKIAEQHEINLSNIKDLNCLILGGSNSVYSLSAEQISIETGMNCYNLSLIKEGYSFSSYWGFIKSLPLEFSNIRHVFYSSLTPMRDDNWLAEKYQNELNGITISGDQSFSFLGRSLASALLAILRDKELFTLKAERYPLPNNYGDFNFSKFNWCEEVKDPSSVQTRNMASLENWTESQTNTMSLLFPNANIYFVLPSELRGAEFNLSWQNETIRTIKNVIKDNYNVSIMVQPPYDNNTQLCNSKHHANESGRTWRTNDLISRLIDVKAKKN